jgi:hypothetical protein
LIWFNGKSKRRSIAEMMDIEIVTPSWITKLQSFIHPNICHDESDGSAMDVMPSQGKLDDAALLIALNPIPNDANEFLHSTALSHSVTRDLQSVDESVIPTPGFKALKQNSESKSKRIQRRSERISESKDVHVDSDEDEGEMVKEQVNPHKDNQINIKQRHSKNTQVGSRKTGANGKINEMESIPPGKQSSTKKRSIVENVVTSSVKRLSTAVDNDFKVQFISLTGFENKNGDKLTILNLIEELNQKRELKAKELTQKRKTKDLMNVESSFAQHDVVYYVIDDINSETLDDQVSVLVTSSHSEKYARTDHSTHCSHAILIWLIQILSLVKRRGQYS